MTNMDDFHYEEKLSRATAKWTLYAVSKDEWDTKEDTGKSMNNALYILRTVHQKTPLRPKRHRTVKKSSL